MQQLTLRFATAAVVCGAMLAVWPAPAVAADWQFNPRVELGAQADSNYRLLPSGAEESVAGGFADVALQLRSLGPIDELLVTPAVHATRFQSSRDDNSTDPSLDVSYTHHGQTLTAGLLGAYSKASVVRTDRATVDTSGGGLGTPVPGDSGYVIVRNRRELTQFSPSVAYEFTQRDRLLVVADYVRADYDHEIPGFYVGYRNLDGSVGLAHDYSPRTTLTLRARYAQYDPNGSFLTTNSYGLEGEWGRHVSQISQAYVRLGALRSVFGHQGAVTSPAVTSVVAGAGVNWDFRPTQLFVDATRTLDPNARGYSILRDQLRLRVEHELTAKSAILMGVRAYQDTAAGNSALFPGRKYLTGTLGVRWRFERSWAIAAAYDYVRQRYQVDPAAAESNSGTLSLIYQPVPPG
jgi:hypothetical protein